MHAITCSINKYNSVAKIHQFLVVRNESARRPCSLFRSLVTSTQNRVAYSRLALLIRALHQPIRKQPGELIRLLSKLLAVFC